VVKGQVIGVLGVKQPQDRPDVQSARPGLLEDLASHAAIATGNARSTGESVMRSRELADSGGGQRSCKLDPGLRAVLLTICEQLVSARRSVVARLAIANAHPGSLEVVARYLQSHWSDEQSPQIQPSRVPILHQVLQERQPRCLGLDEASLEQATSNTWPISRSIKRVCFRFTPMTAPRSAGTGLPNQAAADATDEVLPASFHQKSRELIVSHGKQDEERTYSKQIAWEILAETGANCAMCGYGKPPTRCCASG